MKTNRYEMQVVMPNDTLEEFVSNLFTNEEIEDLIDNGMLNRYIDDILYDCIDDGYSEEWCFTELKQHIIDEYDLEDDLEDEVSI